MVHDDPDRRFASPVVSFPTNSLVKVYDSVNAQIFLFGGMMSGSIDVTIEIPRGTRNKYEYDHEQHVIRLNRHLTSSMGYPAEYGFFPDTLGGDGDPLDVLVLTEFPTFPGCVIGVRVVGACFKVDEHGDDAKLIAVPAYDPQWKEANDITDIPKRTLDEIRHFFSVYKDLDEGKWVKMGNYEGREVALKELAECRERFRVHQSQA
jgi:inorganic pyrophosphatase